MGRIRLQAKRLAVVACMVFLAHCGGEIVPPQTGDTVQESRPAPPAAAAQAPATWVSCLPPQAEPPLLPVFLCPSTAPGHVTMTLTAHELIPKIEAAIAVNNPDGEVTDIALTFQQDAFIIQGTLQRPIRTTIQVSGRLVVRDGKVEADAVKGRLGIIPVPAGYMAEAMKDANKHLDTFFRTEYGIRVTSVHIVPGELRLTGETLR